jgi:hypothetical protein
LHCHKDVGKVVDVAYLPLVPHKRKGTLHRGGTGPGLKEGFSLLVGLNDTPQEASFIIKGISKAVVKHLTKTGGNINEELARTFAVIHIRLIVT